MHIVDYKGVFAVRRHRVLENLTKLFKLNVRIRKAERPQFRAEILATI